MRFFSNDSGQGLAEYALIVGLVAVAVIAAVTLFGSRINDLFTNTAAQIPDGT